MPLTLNYFSRDDKIVLLLLLLLVGFIGWAVFTHKPTTKPSLTPTSTQVASNDDDTSNQPATAPAEQQVLGVNSDAQCHINGKMPDAACTPGASDPAVTQDNINQTICVSGYSKTVRPDVSYTSKLKQQQITAYGYTDTTPSHYEEDHLISLELGGAPTDPKNLWPEPGASPNAKDKVENKLHDLVCTGSLPLADAQHRIATNWTTALAGL